jgi:hypothetical protein
MASKPNLLLSFNILKLKYGNAPLSRNISEEYHYD